MTDYPDPDQPARANFWAQQCPQRGPTLTHAHWNECAQNHLGHVSDQCCHCEKRAGDMQALQPPTPTVHRVLDHPYRWTMAGRCGECRGLEDDHPTTGAPDPETGCDLDHASLNPKRLDGADGATWSTCPRCGVMVEPARAQHAPVGQRYGRGRLPFTRRHMAELAVIKAAFEGGYFHS